MLKNLNKRRVVLASQSPRRQNLLKELGIEFDVLTKADVDESFSEEMDYKEIPVFLAKKKAKAFKDDVSIDDILITADTIVWNNGRVLGKPTDKNEAIEMLNDLSGRIHKVVTGVCITFNGHQRTFSSISEVHFADLTAGEIEYYVENYKPYDKAGSYGIQEWIGYIGIDKINGSFYNVMGLPIQRLYQELKEIESTI